MGTVFSVRAVPGKGSFHASVISEEPLVIRVGIPEQPEKGKANAALLDGLERMLCCKVEMLAGHKSRKKKLAAECARETIIEMCRKQE